MGYDYPAEQHWWDALFLRLSAPENVPVRRLDDMFLEEDDAYGFPCLQLISEHGGASVKQRQFAVKQIQARSGTDEEDEEE